MTNVFRILLLVVSGAITVQAQDYFEGSVKWIVKLEYADPETIKNALINRH